MEKNVVKEDTDRGQRRHNNPEEFCGKSDETKHPKRGICYSIDNSLWVECDGYGLIPNNFIQI